MVVSHIKQIVRTLSRTQGFQDIMHHELESNGYHNVIGWKGRIVEAVCVPARRFPPTPSGDEVQLCLLAQLDLIKERAQKERDDARGEACWERSSGGGRFDRQGGEASRTAAQFLAPKN